MPQDRGILPAVIVASLSSSNPRLTLQVLFTLFLQVPLSNLLIPSPSLPFAEQSKDFEVLYDTLSFNRCELKRCINVTIKEDRRAERDESFKIFLEWDSAHGQDSILDPKSTNGTITIQDNDGEYSYTE